MLEKFLNSLATRGKTNAQLNWNTMRAELCKDGLSLATIWIGNVPCKMIDIVHQTGQDHTVQRVRKLPRLTSTNTRCTREAFWETGTKKLPIPELAYNYNFKIGDIDISYQMRGVHTSQIATMSTWLSIFFWLISAVTSSYNILSNLDPKWFNSHLKLIFSIASYYIRHKSQSIPMQVACQAEQQYGSWLRLKPKTKKKISALMSLPWFLTSSISVSESKIVLALSSSTAAGMENFSLESKTGRLNAKDVDFPFV